MWTLSYKYLHLHGYCDRDEVRISGLKNGTGTKVCVSLHAAKLYATKVQSETQA